MDDAHLEALLERWNCGDGTAAEEALLACEPYLRMVVRREMSARVRSKFDSADIVQSVWADVVRDLRKADWHFPDADHLRAYLVRRVRHRLIDRIRQNRTAVAAERRLGGGITGLAEISQPAPSEVAQADDLWEQIRTLCPPAHHRLLELKRQGASMVEIAAWTGLHEGSVRRILYDLAKRFANGTKLAGAALAMESPREQGYGTN
jgi:RNA polymerase sigma factor (sigma-70 family)